MLRRDRVVMWLGESELEKIAWVSVEKSYPKRMGTIHTKGAHSVSIESEYSVIITIRSRERGAYVEEVHEACKYLCQELKKRFPVVLCTVSRWAYCTIDVKATLYTLDKVYREVKSILPELLKKAYVPKSLRKPIVEEGKVKFLFVVTADSYGTLTYMYLKVDYLEELQRRKNLICEDAKSLGEKAYYWIVKGNKDAFVHCLEENKVVSKGELLMRDVEAIDIIRKCISKYTRVIESGEC